MESQKENRMIMSVAENLDLCEWLLEQGLSLPECACILCEMECGQTFAMSLSRVFKRRILNGEKLHD